MIITISGTPGSGKSTIAKLLEHHLEARRLYAGEFMRNFARTRALTLQQLLKQANNDPSIDRLIDSKVARMTNKLSQHGQIIIVEGRIQFHLLPDSLKIFITVSLSEAARRIFKDLQNPLTSAPRNENSPQSISSLITAIKYRIDHDRSRLKSLYNVDYLNKNNYDLVVNTTKLSAKQAAQIILKYIKQSQKVSDNKSKNNLKLKLI